jgi:hypothetical protein
MSVLWTGDKICQKETQTPQKRYYTRHWLGERPPLGRAAALLAGCPPPALPLPQTWTCSAVQTRSQGTKALSYPTTWRCPSTDEAQLLHLLLARGLVRRVRAIEVEVRPLGGDSIKIRPDAATNTYCGGGEAEIARAQGTGVGRQELYRVAVREDGGAVREDDAQPELLDNDVMMLWH